MHKGILLSSLFLFSASVTVLADQAEQVINLKDGSQIKGVLSGIDNGTYTIKTPIIGDVHVAASDVASITNPNSPAAPLASAPSQGTNNDLNQQVTASQQKLMSNPQSMAILKEMMQDPQIMQALQDPDLVQAVTSRNYTAVQSNPKVQELMNSPKMKALIEQLRAQQQSSSS